MKYYLKFQDETSAELTLFDGETPCYKNTDVIGVIYKPTGVMLTNSDSKEYSEMVQLDGWHVNVLVLPDEDAATLEPYRVIPTNPVRVWA